MFSIDHTYRRFLRSLPPELGIDAKALPRMLRLTDSASNLWSDFVRLSLNHSLPRFAGRVSKSGNVAKYLRAHHLGLIWGILADRIADNQVSKTEGLAEICPRLSKAWAAALEEACGNAAAVRDEVSLSLRYWQRGIDDEQRAFQKKEMLEVEYARMLLDKLYWIGAATRLMVRQAGVQHTRIHFEQAHAMFVCACQCFDDATDVEEDTRYRSISVPELLGASPTALYLSAIALLDEAEAGARRAGLSVMAEWLSVYSEVRKDNLSKDMDKEPAFGGLVLTTAIRNAVKSRITEGEDVYLQKGNTDETESTRC